MKQELKTFILLMVIITSWGCKEQQKYETIESVDCSFYAGYLKSIKVFVDGKTYMRYDNRSRFNQDLLESRKLYSFTLDKMQLDSISKMANSLLSNGINSFSESSTDNSLSFSIIIKSSNKQSQNTPNKEFKTNDDLKLLYQLVNYLDELSNNLKDKVDTAFVFQSRVNLIPPSPLTKKK